jgi:putative nucleotidyltransferase with HDIG domain
MSKRVLPPAEEAEINAQQETEVGAETPRIGVAKPLKDATEREIEEFARFASELMYSNRLNEGAQDADTDLDKWSRHLDSGHEHNEDRDPPMAARATVPRPAARKQLRPSSIADAVGAHRPSEGHGRRLTAAFEALEAFPVLAESRNRLLSLVVGDPLPVAEIVDAVESDIALVVAVLRLANDVTGRTRGRVDSIVDAVHLLSPEAVQGLATRARTFDFFERSTVWDAAPERFRLHAMATRTAADRLAVEIAFDQTDRLAVSALLHDIGKLVLLHAYAGYPGQVHRGARTPAERVRAERRELGVDHALVGGVLARRWGLPKTVASTIERHHTDELAEEAALVRIADMLAHYANGSAIAPSEMLKAGRIVGIGAKQLRRVMYDLPRMAGNQRRRAIEACPLSTREMDVLKRLAEGKVYKQIAHELMLSTSTVRTHLHNVYGKLGAVDRAQAVLIATERGWL